MSSLEPRFDAQFCPSRSSDGVACDQKPPHRGHAHAGWVLELGKRIRKHWTDSTEARAASNRGRS